MDFFMKQRKALSLLEMCLTLTLASILMASLFAMAKNQKRTLQRLQDNTVALYMLESMRNFARFQVERGVGLDAISSGDLEALIESRNNWAVLVKVSETDGFRKLVISLARVDSEEPDAVYVTEVVAK
ncbi:MAG: hypothetical protein CVV41_21570 [Candidatus Riflebacteria bacterium HGW-Riflebacteria-1]|jgi:competence protein ComGC|nr:MAG: hypothetical protein CVV41_21570 [Candidatus Riflebacteria bacterium HGW-Riflebacteria-1]